MSHTIAKQIDYKEVTPTANPRYRLLRVPLTNLQGNSTTITATTSQLLQFKLPTCVYNLSRSYLSYQVSVTAQGAGNYTYLTEDAFEIATNAYFGTAGGLDICNLNYVNRYTKVARKVKTKLQDFIPNDPASMLYPCNSAAGTANNPPSGVDPPTDPGNSTVNYLEPRYTQVSGANAVLVGTRQYPLNGIVDTIFAVDKDLYIPQDMYVSFMAGVGNQLAWVATSATVPTSATAVTGNISLNNIYLFLAVEQNQLIIDSVMNKVMTSGLRMIIPYTTAFRNGSLGTNANITIPLTQQYGKKLKRMVHTVWDDTESGNTAMDCSNSNGSKIVSYNTYLDQRQLQDYPLSCAAATATAINQDDYLFNQKFLIDSVLLNRKVYQLSWCHIDQFYENNSSDKSVPDDNLDDGLDMHESHLWTIQATTANAGHTHYDFATFVRVINISRNGIEFSQQ